MRKRTFKEVIEEHDRQIAWQKAVIREEARESIIKKEGVERYGHNKS